MRRRFTKWFLRLLPVATGIWWIAHCYERQQKRRWVCPKRLLVLLGLCGLLIVTVTALYVRSFYGERFVGQSDNCAVVFGAAVWRDDIPSHALSDRTQAAIKLYQNGRVNCLRFSGGASKFGAHEVAVMQRLALEAGISADRLQLDWEGNNTLATLLNLPQKRDWVLVSNDFHLARINLMAARLGLSQYHLHAASYQEGRYQKAFEYFWREVLGTLIIWWGLAPASN